MRITRHMVVLFIGTIALCACAYGQSDVKSNKSVRTVSFCELAKWGKSMTGGHVRFQANYLTDFRHGAVLSDDECPSFSLRVGVRPDNEDESLKVFDKFMVRYWDFYVGHKFRVDITGVFGWDDETIINAELPRDRQLHIPPRGVISIVKVWDFERPKE